MNNNPLSESSAINAEQVADYLNQHRDFFVDRPSLLADMHVVHDVDGAVSLVERQMAVLRKQNSSVRQHIDKLLENARNNDRLFEKTRNLTLSLLEANDRDDLISRLSDGFRNDFDIHYMSLLIYGELAQAPANYGVRMVPLSEVKKYLPALIDNRDSVCGQLSADQQQFVFAEQAASIHSTAMISFSYHSPIGLLAIGHSDKAYFNADMDTVFLRYIGDVLARLLLR